MNRFAFRTLAASLCFTTVCLFPANARIEPPVGRQFPVLVTLRSKDMPIGDALKELTKQYKIQFTFAPDVPNLADYPWPVNMSFTDQSVENAVKLLLRSVPGKGTARLACRQTGPTSVSIYWEPFDETGLPDVTVTASFKDQTVYNVFETLSQEYGVGFAGLDGFGRFKPDDEVKKAIRRVITYSCKERKLRDVVTDLLHMATSPDANFTLEYGAADGGIFVFRPFAGESRPGLPDTHISRVFLQERAISALIAICDEANVKLDAADVQGYINCSIGDKPFSEALHYLLSQIKVPGKMVCIIRDNHVAIYQVRRRTNVFADTSRIPVHTNKVSH